MAKSIYGSVKYAEYATIGDWLIVKLFYSKRLHSIADSNKYYQWYPIAVVNLAQVKPNSQATIHIFNASIQKPSTDMFVDVMGSDTKDVLSRFSTEAIAVQPRMITGVVKKVTDEMRKVVAQIKKQPLAISDPVAPNSTFTVTKKLGNLPITLDGITYEGFGASALKTHSLDAIHQAILACIKTTKQKWFWVPKDMIMQVHTTSNAMGLALNPGSGVHVLSLKKELLLDYDLGAIVRVVLHELCHHYREERWPRNRSNPYADSHDEKFCDALAQVDPLITDKKQCQYFCNETWVKGRSAQQKQAVIEEDPAQFKALLRINKSGAYKLNLVPPKGRSKVLPVGGDMVNHLHGIGWSARDLNEIAFGIDNKSNRTWSQSSFRRYEKPASLWQFLNLLADLYPQDSYGFKLYLNTLGG